MGDHHKHRSAPRRSTAALLGAETRILRRLRWERSMQLFGNREGLQLPPVRPQKGRGFAERSGLTRDTPRRRRRQHAAATELVARPKDLAAVLPAGSPGLIIMYRSRRDQLGLGAASHGTRQTADVRAREWGVSRALKEELAADQQRLARPRITCARPGPSATSVPQGPRGSSTCGARRGHSCPRLFPEGRGRFSVQTRARLRGSAAVRPLGMGSPTAAAITFVCIPGEK